MTRLGFARFAHLFIAIGAMAAVVGGMLYAKERGLTIDVGFKDGMAQGNVECAPGTESVVKEETQKGKTFFVSCGGFF